MIKIQINTIIKVGTQRDGNAEEGQLCLLEQGKDFRKQKTFTVGLER